jgi:hypothetical protein
MSKKDNDRNASRQMLNKLSQYSQKELYNDDDDDDFLFEIENLKSNKKTQKSETKKRRSEEY